MSTTPIKRTRSERVASIPGRPNSFRRLSEWISEESNWPRIGLAALTALAILIVFRCWEPPFAFRAGQIPPRDVVARTTFQVHDRTETELLQRQKRREVLVSMPIAFNR